jgi:hypothetical protein
LVVGVTPGQVRPLTDVNVKPALPSFVEGILVKLGVALIFSVMLAIATAAPLEQGLRYISTACLLISLWLFGLALARRRRLGTLSEWGEGLFFSLMAACVHFLVGLSN